MQNEFSIVLIKMIRAISLDAAGTLFDLAAPVGLTYSTLAEKYGISLAPQEAEKRFLTSFRRQTSPCYSANCDGEVAEREWWQRIVHEVFHEAPSETLSALFDELFQTYARAAAWKLFPDTIPFLESVSSLYRLIVLSNFDSRLHPLLSELQLTPFFEAVITSAAAKACKPNSEIFLYAAQQLALPPSAILHIGDSRSADYEGALKAGFQTIHLDRKKQTLKDLKF